MNIYSFYYDEKKKRYFRVLNNINKYHPFLSSSTASSSSSSSTFSRKHAQSSHHSGSKKISSIPQAVSMKEINNTECNVQECLLKARLKQIKLKSSSKLNLTDYRGNDMIKVKCEYLLGDPDDDSLYGVWAGDYQNGCVIKRVSIRESIYKEKNDEWPSENLKTFINAFPSANKVKDLSVVNMNEAGFTLVMCLTNHVSPGFSTYSSVGVHYVSHRYELQAQDFAHNYEFRETFYSCSCHNFQTLAIGGQDFIRLFTSTYENSLDSINYHTLIKLDGKATSLKFSPDGNRLYAGTNTGLLVLFDVRNKKEINRISLNTQSIAYLHLCRQSEDIIASCHNNQLLSVDVRNLKAPLLTFQGHVNDCHKIPVSVDESVNIISSMGRDYYVRFWSLKSGRLLHEIPPLSSDFSNPFKDDSSLSYSWFSQSWKSLKGAPKPIVFVSHHDKLNHYH